MSPLAALLLAAGLALAPNEAAGIDTFSPGPFAVGRWDWDFGLVSIPEPGSGGELFDVQHYGTFRYPAAADGELAPGLAGRPVPLVVFAHGRFQTGPTVGSNHLQATYLLEHLASWGFAVASVNLDVVGQFALPSAVGQRGRLIRETVAAFERRHDEGSLPVHGLTIDFQRLAFVGHSRGGEGCVKAWLQSEDRARIRAIATIAPTDFAGDALLDVPYLSVYGSKDGDVNNGWPIQLYDRADGVRCKGFQYVEGANHFWFTDSLHFSLEGPGLITREQHHEVARTYIAAFLLASLHGERPLPFDHLVDGPQLQPVTDEVVVHPLYRSPDALVVDDFQDQPLDVASNSLGQPVVWDALSAVAEESLKNPSATLYHETRGLAVEFVGAGEFTPLLLQTLPAGTDATPYRVLSLSALQRRGSVLNTPGEPQDLLVALGDARGRTATLPLSAFGAIPWPIAHGGASFPTKSVLRTTRIPLTAFLAVTPDLDLADLAQVALVFDQTPSGELRLDDLSFSN